MAIATYAPISIRRLIFRRVRKRLGGALELIFTGGAALDLELGAKWEKLGVRIIQAYGATEASPGISIHPIHRPDYRSSGPPVPGVEVKVEEDGELLIRGPNLTQGYWEASDRTAEVFSDGWYKTGDLGFIDEHGSVHVKGRKKDMIVLSSGQNVYPEDVEAALSKHPDVTDATVVGLPREDRVEVHAVLLMENPDKAQEAVSWANGQLADHQRIRGHTVWPEDDLPRTHTLKVKKALVLERLTGPGPVASGESRAQEDSPDDARGPVGILVAEVAGLPAAEVRGDMRLGEDLDLDSLKRVELLTTIEERLGVYVDEMLVSPNTTVRQLEALVDAGSPAQTKKFPRWGMALWCTLARGLLQRGLVFPLTSLAYKIKVSGTENLDTPGPVLIAANHTLHLDNGIILKSLPSRRRRRLAIAASVHMWSNPIRSLAIPLLGNGFPFSKEGNFRKSLENVGRIIDGGWSVLIYPEGELTVAGPMKPFMGGTGLVCVGGRVPVVPLRLVVLKTGFPSYLPLLRRDEVEVRIGKSLSFDSEATYLEATAAIEAAVRSL